jgi:ABC-type proline/glycine betaine transport system ATPase subunit
MSDKIKNYYENLPKDLRRENKVNNTFKNHHILPNSMICAIGGTGTGKTNSILDMIHRMDGTFYQIIVFNPVSTDELKSLWVCNFYRHRPNYKRGR